MLRIETQIYLIGVLVGLAHIASGVGVLVEPRALNVTALAALHSLATWASLAGWVTYDAAAHVAGILLTGAGLCAVGAVLSGCSRRTECILFIPQQLLLLCMAYTITVATVTGIYPDKYAPPGGGWFLQNDQVWAWILAVSHSALLAAYLYGNNQGARGGQAT